LSPWGEGSGRGRRAAGKEGCSRVFSRVYFPVKGGSGEEAGLSSSLQLVTIPKKGFFARSPVVVVRPSCLVFFLFLGAHRAAGTQIEKHKNKG